MKPFQQLQKLRQIALTLAAASSVLFLTHTANATVTTALTVDLEAINLGAGASVSGTSNAGQVVSVTGGVGTSFQVNVWADVQDTNFSSANTYAVQSLMGDILQNTSGGMKGTISPVTILTTPWDNTPGKNYGGAQVDLNGDGTLDLGIATTNTNYYSSTLAIKASTNPNDGDSYYAYNGTTPVAMRTNHDPNGSGVGTDFTYRTNPFGDGIQFLLGTFTYTVTAATGSQTINWMFLPTTIKTSQAAAGTWATNLVPSTSSSGGNYYYFNSTAGYTMSNTSPAIGYAGQYLTINVGSVPEPGTWAMLVGGIGMLAFGQRLKRRV